MESIQRDDAKDNALAPIAVDRTFSLDADEV